jgi:hypothetical protein
MEDNWERLGRLQPEKKVMIAISMTDGVVSICAEGIRQQNPYLNDEAVLEKIRERLEWARDNR